MAIPAAPNSVSFSQIQSEMGGSNPISLNEYYSGGSLVKANLGIFAPNGVPTSGAISVEDFRGAENTSEFWTTSVNFTQAGRPIVGGTVAGRSILGSGAPAPVISDTTPDNGRVMKSSTLLELFYLQPQAAKGSPPSAVSFNVTLNPTPSDSDMNNDTDAFKFITDAGVRTYQRNAATYNAVTNTFHTWVWGSSPFGPQSTRDVTFDCN